MFNVSIINLTNFKIIYIIIKEVAIIDIMNIISSPKPQLINVFVLFNIVLAT